MSVMLSAASCLDWAAKLTGLASVPALIAAAQTADESAGPVVSCPICLANARRTTTRRLRASFFGLTHQHGPAELARAVLEGVGYALADGMDVVHACGIKPQSITLIGGGRAALTGGKCWRISAACSSITVPGAMSARRWGRPGWRSWRFTTRQTAPGC